MPFYTVFKMAWKKWNESYVHTETFRWMLMVALFIITPSWKIPNILILRMDKLCYIFTMEYSPSTENDNYWCLQQYGWISKALGWAKKKWKWKSLSHVWLFATPQTIRFMEFSRPEYWSSFSLLQGIFPTQGSNPGLPNCRQILYQLSHKGSLFLAT